VFDIRATAEQPWCRLAFDYQHGGIPVPGYHGMRADSVTGTMEALKLVGPVEAVGRINLGYLSGAGRVRHVPEGHRCSGYHYRGRPVGLGTARVNILVPSYLWVLSNQVADVVCELRRIAKSRTAGLFDGDSPDILSDERLSAAALLAAYLSGQMIPFQHGEPVHQN
jgi:hypothetical protein